MSRYALWAAFGPISWPLWALLIAAVALVGWRQRGWKVARASSLAGLLLALLIFVVPIGYVLIEFIERRFSAHAYRNAEGTDIVVLAGGEKLAASLRRGIPQFGEHGERVTAGAALARVLPNARLWAVGGVQAYLGEPYDVDYMAAVWRDLGVDTRRIVKVRDTTDTCENAHGVARRIRKGAHIVLVTSAFHMPRAVACFREAGLDPDPFPVDFQNGPHRTIEEVIGIAPLENADRVQLALHEYVGLAYYYLNGRISDPWPAPRTPRAASVARTVETPRPATHP